jgi:hypothetical protein
MRQDGEFMATVSNSLKLFDAMSGPLKSITNAMNLTISTMQRMQNATNQNVRVDRSLIAAKQQLASAEAQIQTAIDQATRSQNRFNESVKKSHKSTGELLGSVKAMAAAYLSIEGAKRLYESTVGAAMEQQSMIDAISARTGNKAQGQDIFNQLSKQALQYGQDVKASLLGAQSFMSNTMDPKKLTQLNMLAMRLSKLNPEEGLAGAAFSLKELMSGDYTSIAERFNMSRTMLQNSAARKAGQKNDVDGFIKGMDELLNMQNMTQKAFEQMLDSPAAKWDRIVQAFKFKMTSAGREALATLEPLFNTIGNAFNSGKFDAFFSTLQKGLTIAVRVINDVIKGVSWLYNTLTQYSIFNVSFGDLFNILQAGLTMLENAASTVGDYITRILNLINQARPVIIGLLSAIATVWLAMIIRNLWAMVPALTANVARLWAMIPPLLAQAGAWLALNWPILLVAAIIGAVVAAVIYFGVSTQQVVGVVVGVFYSLYASVMNVVALMWNIFASWAEFLMNLFIDPVYAIKKLFYDLAKTFGDYMVNMVRSAEDFAGGFVKVILSAVNKALEGFNWFVKQANGLFGTEFKTVGMIDASNVHAISSGLQNLMSNLQAPTSSKNVVSIPRMQQKNLSDYYQKGYTAGSNATDKALKSISNLVNGAKKAATVTNPGKYNLGNNASKNIPNVGKVGKVGKIEDTVDISSEDLKMLRELAEMKSIQNFVTLQPSVNLTTGPVTKEADIDTIMLRIEKTLTEDIASSAAGVYNVG